MREAPALVLIKSLVEAGCKINVYDPIATEECRRRIGDVVNYCKDKYDAIVDADALVLVTEWKEFRLPSWNVIKKAMRNTIVIDGRNLYDKQELTDLGFTYYGIGK